MSLFSILLALTFNQAAAPTDQSPAAAHSQYVRLTDGQEVVKVLLDEGYKAKLSKDKDGDPMIESASDGANFTIYFYGCTDNRNCKDLALVSTYSRDPKNPFSLEKANEFNGGNRFGRASIDNDKDLRIEMDIIFTDGLLSRASLVDQIQTWTSVMAGFHKAIGW